MLWILCVKAGIIKTIPGKYINVQLFNLEPLYKDNWKGWQGVFQIDSMGQLNLWQIMTNNKWFGHQPMFKTIYITRQISLTGPIFVRWQQSLVFTDRFNCTYSDIGNTEPLMHMMQGVALQIMRIIGQFSPSEKIVCVLNCWIHWMPCHTSTGR